MYVENLKIVDTNLEKPNIKRRKIILELALTVVRNEMDNLVAIKGTTTPFLGVT